MSGYHFTVGQEFPDVKTFRNTIKEAAIAQHFELKIVKSDLIRYFATCAKEDCPWRIRAVKLPNSPVFTIRSLETTHTCAKNAQLGHHQASVDWIVNFIEERLRRNVNYKPKDILQDIHTQYGITIPYKQAWRAKERGLTNIYGSSEEGYCLLPAHCEQIKHTNPGSIAQVFTTGSSDHRFHRLFVSFNASIHGFLHGCLPVISLGGLQLKSRYLGTLLSVTSFDPDGGLFPVAFGVVDVETDDNWMWFLSEFHKLLEINTDSSMIPKLAVLSSGHKDVVDAVKKKFPDANHAVCLKHLVESVTSNFKNSRLGGLLRKAAYSITATSFKERFLDIEKVCPDAAKWIQEAAPLCRWAVVYIEGSRFGHLCSNTEEFHRWILETRELPIIQVMECIHNQLISEFKTRSEKAVVMASMELVQSAEKRLSEAVVAAASGLQVLRSDEFEFEILSTDHSNIVNIGTRVCSCRDWQLYGIPCSHAVAALLSCKKNIYDYADKCLTMGRYHETYSQPIHPIPAKIEWKEISNTSNSNSNSIKDETRILHPPKFRRAPGRPEKKRPGLEQCRRDKHIVHCSHCNQTGHYKRTCNKVEEDGPQA